MDEIDLKKQELRSEHLSRQYAFRLDWEDPLKHLRAEFIIPSKADLKSKTLISSNKVAPTAEASQPKDLVGARNSDDENSPCTYLCGNSLGLQPRRTSDRIASHLRSWATKGVLGHFLEHEDSPVAPYLPMDDQAARLMAPIVGALPDEVAVMETLTANLHLMMASFYRPSKSKNKIILEGKAFPSDHYAVESQIIHHGFRPEESMILIEAENPDIPILPTSQILSTIDKHASSTSLILLPGVQFYTGQYFDIAAITRHAHSYGIIIGWDLAHAVGNLPLYLHEWGVDFAVWCNYKYMNSGPGAIAGLFVNNKHGEVDRSAVKEGRGGFRPRLCGWWGGDKAIRFDMANKFVPIPGAQGFQVGNGSSLAISALIASLEVFGLTDLRRLRKKSVALTQFLQDLLLLGLDKPFKEGGSYRIITPLNPDERGVQLSVQLQPGLLPAVMASLEAAGVVVDERKPDVIRVAPTPLYNTFVDVWNFVKCFKTACARAQEGRLIHEEDVVMLKGQNEKGWSQVQ